MDCRRFFPAVLKFGLLALAGFGFFGCGQKQATQAPPPPTVTVAKPIKREIVEWLNFSAQTQAVDTVTITPRVTGYIDNITFKEGDIVNFGDLLFVIDPRPYRAAYDSAAAQLAHARAAEQLAQEEEHRAQRLIAVFGRVFGASHVTLHDAHVSIAAGFRDDELPRLLGLDPASWEIQLGTTLLGAYRMTACRRA